jgi:general secretion pathway protein G
MHYTTPRQTRQRNGFSLVELVVVILIMGIIAAVAAPKMFDTTNTARKNSALNSLNVVRNAIELYKGKNEAYPGAGGSGTALATDLTTFLNGPFPKVQVAGSKNDGSVKYETDGNGVSAPDGTTDWLYDTVDGTLKINVTGYETL